MSKSSKTLTTLLAGVAIGAAVGYLLSMDKDKRDELACGLKDKLNDKLNDLKEKFNKKTSEIEEELGI